MTPSKKPRFHKGWCLERISRLEEPITTADVRDRVGICERQLQYWLRDPWFQKNQVAVKVDGNWVWDQERLYHWCAAIFRLEPKHNFLHLESIEGPQRNPPLELPEDYVVRR